MGRRFAVWLVSVLAILMASSAMAQIEVGAETGTGFSDLPAPCGDAPISIARMPWPSAILLAHIHGKILEKEFGCEVQIVAGDLTATGSSMATTGQPAVAPEMWASRIADLWNSALENQSLRRAGPSFSGTALEGWFVPGLVAENHPDLTSAAGLKDYWQVFRAEGESRARFISCPPDWACAVINKNLLKSLGLDGLFEIVEPANRFELDSLIGEAVSRRIPTLFYYWQPNAILSQFSFRQLDLGDYDPDAASCLARVACVVPKPSAFAPEPVVIAVAEWVFTDAPQVAGYFQRAQMPISEMNKLLGLQSEQNKTAEEIAEWFVEQRAEVWRPWLSLF